ncbi:Histone acetylation protein 2 [Penicillium atrosanguineum]|uniref:Elongator complex protein 5 n=1 Tax=Penicillium atrosanguineum TaxID=1132637 RepID=A0A9W9QBV8_9EURO|nr:Histone acetylation protein 2 [Penicillium atrosanguineum]KAJ5330821.1 Histone acetylation protein 2 [Penicillium atrosanguineum]
MAPLNLSHRRTHNLLLISKLLSLRDTASPLTLLQDSLEQPATPLIKEYIRRAKLSKVHVTLIAFETLKAPDGVDAFVSARHKSPENIVKEVAAAYQPSTSAAPSKRRLIIIDAINPLLSSRRLDAGFHLPTFLGSFIAPASPTAKADTSLVVTYHQDVPGLPQQNPYSPSPLTMLTYLATSIITLHSFSHILAQKAARDRSLVAPVFGLKEEQEGVLLGRLDKLRGTNAAEGIVLELEHRRKSGRGVLEWYLLPPASRYSPQQVKEIVTLLDDNVLYNPPMELDTNAGDEEPKSTFELGLTERQRREREGVVLPYFDAQQGNGPGEGGRILYDMGEEDDFDEEEDEI